MVRVLLVEDDPLVRDVILYYLQKEGSYELSCASTAGEALAQARDRFDVILLDILLPDANGIDLCATLRRWHDCPVIFISCLDDSDTVVKALAAGGDAVLSKPFDTRVLTAHIEAALRRYHRRPTAAASNSIRVGTVALDANTHVVQKGGKDISLSDTEFHILAYLMQKTGEHFTPRELYRQIWGADSPGDSRTVLVHIHNLRAKLEDDPANPQLIVMHWGKGYTFVSDPSIPGR